MILRRFVLLSSVLAFATALHAAPPERLELKKGDQVAIVGSGLADRQQHHAWLEALIHKAYPELELTVRNLGFAADEVNVHPRSDEVPTTEYFLGMRKGDTRTTVGKTEVVYKAGTDFSANVILAYWGFNESFKGEAGWKVSRRHSTNILKKQLAADYGKGTYRESCSSRRSRTRTSTTDGYPDGSANNKNRALHQRWPKWRRR